MTARSRVAAAIPPDVHRLDHEPPPAASALGWRFHHVGIPTGVVRPGEQYLEQFGMYVSGFSASPFGVEWMRFEPNSPLHELVKTVPHVAFEVDDLDAALIGQPVICPPGSPSDGVRAAMIVHNGAPIELIWFRRPAGRRSGSRPKGAGRRRKS
jgi:hypothetical protein